MYHHDALASPSQIERSFFWKDKQQRKSSSLIERTDKSLESNSSATKMFSTKGVVRCDIPGNRDMDTVVPSRSSHNTGKQQQLQVVNVDKTKAQIQLYSDEMRISKILRRLMGERHTGIAVELCRKLETAVRTQSNSSYICRSFEYLIESMVALLVKGPADVRVRAAIVLGLIGYIGRSDFAHYQSYLSKTYESEKATRNYVMSALKITISCDAINLDLLMYSDRLLALLKDYLENAERVDIFIAVSETIAEFSRHYKQAFENNFTDIVDIVVGWHLEVDQPHSLKLHCSRVLQQFSPYFIKELNFSFGLLGQFLEDLQTFGDELAAAVAENSESATQKAAERIGSFVGAFNSVLKCLATKTEFVFFSVGREILADALAIIMKVAENSLVTTDVVSTEIILNVNEFFSLVFVNDQNRVVSDGDAAPPLPSIESIVQLQLRLFPLLNEEQMGSLLYLIICFFRHQRTKLPLSMVTLVLGAHDSNPLAAVKMAVEPRPYQLLLKIYHEALMVKNVPLLQEAYRHIIADMDVSVRVLHQTQPAPQANLVTRAETTFVFSLAALSVLATQTSSIIGMYALRPSILELLIVSCGAADMQRWSESPTVHDALLRVIIVHCQNNHNFRTSSRLLSTVHSYAKHHTLDDNNSPTSENLGIILKFLAALLCQTASINIHSLRLVLVWLQKLLDECRPDAALLQTNASFVGICRGLGAAARVVPLESAACMVTLLDYAMLPDVALHCFSKTAICLIDAQDELVRLTYIAIQARLPLRVCLRVVERNCVQRQAKLRDLQHWYHATAHFAPFRSKFFKPFMESIDLVESAQGTPTGSAGASQEQCFVDYFKKCWTAQTRERTVEYKRELEGSVTMLEGWLECEVARYCVRQKLRTSVGKPQETFLAIEAIVMRYARAISNRGAEAQASTPTATSTLCSRVRTQCSIRLLLGFLEFLEKQVHNAAEGTAFALLPLEKPAKTFFRINSHTCSEWFRRIRTSVTLIALHSMQPAMAVRYSECVLRALEKDKSNESLLDHALTALVSALISCREADTLQGLHVWALTRIGKRYAWVEHAAEQAAGQWECAADGYADQLSSNDDDDAQLSAHVKEFLADQLLDCLYNSGQWARMRAVLRHSDMQNLQLANWRSEAHLYSIQWLINGRDRVRQFEAANAAGDALLELAQWPVAEMADDSVAGNLSYYGIVRQLENTCMAHMLTEGGPLPAGIVRAVREASIDTLRHGTVAAAACSSQQSDIIVLNHVVQALNSNGVFSMPDAGAVGAPSALLTKCLLWSTLFARRNGNAEGSNGDNHHVALYLDVAASARSEGNANYCRTMLERFFALRGFVDASLPAIAGQLQRDDFQFGLEDTLLLRGFAEMAQWLHMTATVAGALEAVNVGAAFCRKMLKRTTPNGSYPPASADMLLTLSDWLTHRVAHCNAANTSQLQRLLEQLPEVTTYGFNDSLSVAVIPPMDRAVGRLIYASIMQRSDSSRAWFAFGNWNYRWGKKIVEAGNNVAPIVHRSAHLEPRDIAALEAVLGARADAKMIEELVAVLDSHQLHGGCGGDGVEDIEANEADDSRVSSSTEVIEVQLRKIDLLAACSAEEIDRIIDIWRHSHRSVYTYYGTAARSYFKYLAIQTANGADAQRSSSADDDHHHAYVADCSFVMTTLRLLRLIVKHAVGLQDVLEEGLRTTPLRPWKVIVPQLFSRLNHHEPYVRRSVSELLCRLAQDRPHLIIFPAVVGEQQEFKVASEGEALSTCFTSLLASLAHQAPDTVRHVQLLVKELKRVTLLWEEYWTHALTQLYAEYSPLFALLEAESKKLQQQQQEQYVPQLQYQLNHIIAKYQILLQHVATDVERIAAVTAKPAETGYERSFQERYDEPIRSTIGALRQLPNASKPAEAWQRIKQLFHLFQQRSVRSGGSSAILKVAEISPVLSGMRDTAIAMPGVDTFEKNPIYIRSVDVTVHILLTKTKPKKLAFTGSDGRRYTYLFKGLEDLHLDERIMQFLSISNSMMARSNDAQPHNDAAASTYKAYHYSVIPLGPQSGLISWVDGVTPLFSLYKRWQQRDTALKQHQKDRKKPAADGGDADGEAPPPQPATRPSELFYSKLTPLLAEQKIKTTDPRKQWPLPILRRVLDELSEETPRDLVAKEVWCQANSAADWRQSVRNYTASMAVMSVIGYVIGLGDRHLDNMLIKLSTGEVIHIDYNVCFDKGKTLRVPEKVPFRMTPNFEEALGLTGIEGAFRLGCEHVLRTLRRERETLLTLLEAFVYDPLVDWTMNDDDATRSTATTTATTAAAAPRTTTSHLAAQSLAAYDLANNIGGGGLAAGSSADNDSSKEIPGVLRLRLHKTHERQDTDMIRQMVIAKFNDIKPFMTKYREDVRDCLVGLDRDVRQLAAVRDAITAAEHRRDGLTKQLAMIRDLEALGSAMGSHALNTAAYRFETWKTASAALSEVQQSVRQCHDDIEKLFGIFFGRLLMIVAPVPLSVMPSAGGETSLTLLKQQLLQQKPLPNEFAAVRAALYDSHDSGASTALVKCELARHAMDNTLCQESRFAVECIDALLQYAAIVQFQPRARFKEHRLVRYLCWYRELLNETRSAIEIAESVVQWSREVATSFAAGAVESRQNAACQYAAGMQQIWNNLNLNLQQARKEFDERNERETPAADDIVAALKYNYATSPRSVAAVKRCMWRTLKKANQAFEQFEQTSSTVSGGDEMCLLLDQQLDYIEIVERMWESVCGGRDSLGASGAQHCALVAISDLHVLRAALEALDNIKTAFSCAIPEAIVRLFMRASDDDCAALRAALAVVCSGQLNPPPQSSAETATDALNDLRTLLSEIEELFIAFDQRLESLRPILNKIVSLESSTELRKILPISLPLSPDALDINAANGAKVIARVFEIARDQCAALCVHNVQSVYDLRLIAAPITQDYVEHVERSYLSGLTTLFVNACVCAAAIDSDNNAAANNSDDTEDMTAEQQAVFLRREMEAESLCQQLFAAQQHQTSLRHYHQQVVEQTQRLEHHTLVSSAYHWCNKALLREDANPSPADTAFRHHIVSKTNFLDTVQNACQALTEWKDTIVKIQNELDVNIAVLGNNELIALAERSNVQNARVHFHLQLATQLIDCAGVLLQFELLAQDCAHKDTDDEGLIAGLRQWHESEQNCRSTCNALTYAEKAIVQLLDPEGKIDHCWINNVAGLLDEMTDTVQGELVNYELNERTLTNRIKEIGIMLQPQIDTPLRLELRHLVKLVTKGEKNGKGFVQFEMSTTISWTSRVREVQQAMKSFGSQLVELQAMLGCVNDIEMMTAKMVDIASACDQIYAEFLLLMERFVHQNLSELTSESRGALTEDGSQDVSSTTNIADKKVVEQKRNAYAVSVWKRIRMKLEGRDPDPNRRSTVSEQVEYIVQEALNRDNLAVLYEGWTPWV